MNWGSAVHLKAEGIDAPGMRATALALSDGRQRFVMVDLDALTVVGMENIVERAAAATGIPASNIRLGASHTHAGPAFSPERAPIGADLSEYRNRMTKYRADLEGKIVQVIADAVKQLAPAHLYAGRGIGTINVNRRFRPQGGYPGAVGQNPEEFVDRELVVIRIDRPDGKPYAIIGNFQCHGTVLGYENRLISPDWIGAFRTTLETAFPGTMVLYFQGAAGDQGPIEGFTGDREVARRLGATLGHQAAAVALGIDTVRRDIVFEGYVESTAYQAKQPRRVKGPRDAQLKFVSRVIQVPAREYTAEEVAGLEKSTREAEARLERAKSDSAARPQAEARVRRLRNLLNLAQHPSQELRSVELQILRIGDVAIVAMPGEPFSEIGAAIKKASPFAFTMFCGYSTGKGGDYMPVASEYRFGGYEVERTPYGRQASQQLVEQTTQLFNQVK